MKRYKPNMLYAHQKSFNFAKQYGARSVKLAIMMGFITEDEGAEMRATKRGGDRQDLHERIRRHAFAASERLKEHGGTNDLVDRIAGDRAFGLDRAAIDDVLDPARHIGRAPEQVDRFLEENVQPVLARYPELEAAPELRA